ncbi:bifunctional aminoglycoside phosphotransferase/ATP-binding protein [Geminocystis herdmanii]|uniref:bifunctional aminoglycoside phosphotransferase/ATP-binding protein n=1 Tax=Geminocystis herdmanii TaxID=669359 RepID=UPI000344C5A6|nr:AAA family ATPase [Geminocystis herdmanii]
MYQEKLIQKMQEGNFYPHKVNHPIEIIQTHCSIVFLTGDYAYKMKKKVDFGFLDYSTLEKRKHFLEEELRMNKTIAPELYLQVIPISYFQEEFIFNDDSQSIEYILKMRQFPQENLFLNLFEVGKLTEKHLQDLGKIVANFHKNTDTNDYINSFGTAEKIGESINQNYQQTAKYIGEVQTLEKYQQTKAFTDNFLRLNENLFKQRQINHKIRECHGDLHLKNICIWQDKIQLFDRIEFNEPFRFVDVMYDVAFLVMDINSKGEKELANVFLNTYLERTGDWEGLQVLPLYLSRQAYVRAKVTSFLLDDSAITETLKKEAKKNADDYYNLAWQYTQKSQGKLILMSGLSGSGKSTIARKIAQQNNAIHIRSDAVRKHLAGISLEEKGDDFLYSSSMTQKTYERLFYLAKLLTKQGFTIILDAKFDRVSLRQPMVEFAIQENIDLQIIYCTAPLNILFDRLQQRKGDISDATPELLAQQQAKLELFTDTEKAFLKIINTEEN